MRFRFSILIFLIFIGVSGQAANKSTLGSTNKPLILSDSGQNGNTNEMTEEIVASMDEILNLLIKVLPEHFLNEVYRLRKLNSFLGIQFDGHYFYGKDSENHNVKISFDELGIYYAMKNGQSLKNPAHLLSQEALKNFGLKIDQAAQTPEAFLKALALKTQNNSNQFLDQLQKASQLINQLSAQIYQKKRENKALDQEVFFQLANTIGRLTDEGAWPFVQTSVAQLKETAGFLSEALAGIADGKTVKEVEEKIQSAEQGLISLKQNIQTDPYLKRFEKMRWGFLKRAPNKCLPLFN